MRHIAIAFKLIGPTGQMSTFLWPVSGRGKSTCTCTYVHVPHHYYIHGRFLAINTCTPGTHSMSGISAAKLAEISGIGRSGQP